MNTASPTQRRRAWVIPALVALVVFLGAVVSNLVAADLQSAVAPYRPWVWGAFVVALLVTVVTAARDYRRDAGGMPVDLRQAAAEYTDLRRRYLTRIVERFQYLPLRAVDFKTASADTSAEDRLRMSDVYIALNTTARKEGLSAGAKAGELEGRSGRLLARGNPAGGGAAGAPGRRYRQAVDARQRAVPAGTTGW